MKKKYFLSTNFSSEYLTNSKEELIKYILEELERIEKENPQDVFDISITSYEEENEEV